MNRIVSTLATLVLAGAAACTAAVAQTSSDLNMLETQLRYTAVNTPEFGRALGSYWTVIAASQDFARAHSFFDDLAAASPRPDATLLAEKASATGAYVGWLYQHRPQVQVTDQELQQMLTGAVAEYDRALTLEPDNFAALYGYAVFEGYRPEGKEHQKELLAKLDTLRASKPYLPWAMVDQLEKTGRPE